MQLNIVTSKLAIIFGFTLFHGLAFSQINPIFFPDFQAFPANPIIHYGDGFPDAAWNDPCVLKLNGQYIMYLTAAEGIILSANNTVKVYRMVSNDGISWTLSPATPVLEPALGTYYEGGTETPSVVFKDSMYHMYLTCYPPGNVASEFVIAHASSLDGINWNMDATPILTSDGNATFYGELVGEPGAIVYQDSICVFFTAAGLVNGNFVQTIGLMKSSDGTTFGAPQPTVFLPQNVYPLSDNYWGLSTPSALTINDSIYLFTDVARVVNGEWTQVALHQFKTYGNSGIWFADTLPIHTMQDFIWTDGDYLSNLLAITPLMDDNGLLRIWYSGYRLADVNGVDTTYNVSIDSSGFLHVIPDYWGIGTSTYQFQTPVSNQNLSLNKSSLSLFPNPSGNFITINSSSSLRGAEIFISEITGNQVLNFIHPHEEMPIIDLHELKSGLYFLSVCREENCRVVKFMVHK